jgi:hypothetical protein
MLEKGEKDAQKKAEGPHATAKIHGTVTKTSDGAEKEENSESS